MANKRKSVMIDEDYKSDDGSHPYLPADVILENVLTRLSAKDLARFASVSKFWYYSIVNDTGFALSHFARHQNRRNLCFNLLNVPKEDVNDGILRNYFFNLQKDNTVFYNFELLLQVHSLGSIEPVGNCNGLACFTKCQCSDAFEEMVVINPLKRESLTLTCVTPEIGRGGESFEYKYLCHGFGFDSSSQVYKIVVIYTTSTTAGEHGFICMVVTLGVRSWRKIVTSTCDILPPPGCSPFPSQMVTTMWGDDDDISATICGGDLLWRISNYTSGGDDEMEMLLSFDICTEKIQFIQLPPECNSLIHNLDTAEDNCYELRHHLLEFKGYPCVARSEKTWIGERVEYHFKVHLFILKDKVDQIWIEEETFNVRLKEDGVELDSLLRDPFDRYFNKTRRSNDHRSHRTRMCSFSDQVMLYWFDGGCLIFYNLRMNHHNVVKGANPCTGRDRRDIFNAKLKGMATNPGSDSDDVPHCPCIDYQLHAQVENIISVKTFIPKGGEVGEFDNYEEFQQFLTDKQPVGWVATGRKSPKWYAFI